MMSVLLRHAAARRLGGSMVQRAQAAPVAEERRRLGQRLVHTQEVYIRSDDFWLAIFCGQGSSENYPGSCAQFPPELAGYT
jgi:hypothetical protein